MKKTPKRIWATLLSLVLMLSLYMPALAEEDVHSVGDGALLMNDVAPKAAPSEPTNFTTVVGNGTITVTWGAPVSDGGSAIKSYEIYLMGAGASNTWEFLSPTVFEKVYTGLTNGSSYSVFLLARNEDNVISSQVYKTGLIPKIPAPGKPRNLQASQGDRKTTLTWQAPAENANLVEYYVITQDGVTIDTVAASVFTVEVDRLTNDQEYTFGVAAMDDDGNIWDATTVNVTPRATPNVYSFDIIPGNGQVTIRWDDPAYYDDGGLPITSFLVDFDDSGNWVDVGLVTEYTFTNLPNGTRYWFGMSAINASGQGGGRYIEGAAGTTPGKPTNVGSHSGGDAGSGEVDLNWAAPADDGGRAILRYEVSVDNGQSWIEVSSNDLSYTFTGLTDGVEYDFLIRAVNELGAGESATISGTPEAPGTTIGKPQNVKVKPANEKATMTWDAPKGFEGDKTIEYEVSLDGINWVSTGTSRSHTFTGLDNDTEYNFFVRVAAREGQSESDPVEVDATPTAPEEEEDDEDSDIPQTGDDSTRLMVWLWVLAISTLAAGAMAAVLWLRKRRSEG